MNNKHLFAFVIICKMLIRGCMNMQSEQYYYETEYYQSHPPIECQIPPIPTYCPY